MHNLKLLEEEIDALEKLQADLAGIAKRDDLARRNDLVDLRRKLAAQISRVGNVADPIFAKLEDPLLRETYRSKFSSMRAAAATHQANWPAVMLGERQEEYQASAMAVREANRDFVAWIRETMKQIG